MPRVVVVDDQRSVRETLKSCLASEPEIEIVGFADNGQTAIQQVEQYLPDIVLMDIEMPIMDGLTATQIISERFVYTKVLLLTVKDDKQELTRAFEVGARGYILKNTDPKEIGNIIRLTLKGYFQVGPIITGLSSTESLYSSESAKKEADRSLDAEFVLSSLISNVAKLQETVLLQENSLSNLKDKYAIGQEQIRTKLNSERFFAEIKNIQFESKKMKLRVNKVEQKLLFLGGVLSGLALITLIIAIVLCLKVFLD